MSLINLMFAPFVVAARMPLLFVEATDQSRWNPEHDRMIREKIDAARAGWFAAQRSLVASSHEAVRASLRGDAAAAGLALLRTGPRAAEASLLPAARKVGANLQRLSGKRR